MANKIWFITGAANGFGRHWTEAALERGDRVAATARDRDRLADLAARHGDAILPLTLDVTDRTAAFAAVRRAAQTFGGLDVVVNNAGYGHFGMVEELTEEEIRAQLETNFFGALWVTQAALPVLRARGGGHIVQVTSEGGVVAFPGIGAYHASKWALEGLSESLRQEVAGLGIHVTALEPGPYATGFADTSRHSAPLAAYDAVRENDMPVWDVGDPVATRAAILELVDAAQPPSRVLFGRSLPAVTADYERRLRTWTDWNALSLKAFR
ncbi:short-chain dehydrogenase/reductase [Virgisporangium aliadipatigenens]|uniref:Short-chain dehydrogenase/reductase n=1 Tax=Virgisporangium aliadipatigenens TaxID=741659 RepID=A0A8J3YJZ8_9ACTN|nr:SDR family NAD(P)-dependent oxidoreductase [Virgisporangium aliadipatigenens]GIJ45248.1 short-chain dehydrogenase/reductase [Virgisporangium aliadipatigenens]